MKKWNFSHTVMVLFLTTTVTIIGCKKDKDTKDPNAELIGYWEGTQANSNMKFAFLLGQKGYFRLYSDYSTDTATASKAVGTFQLSGTNFTWTSTMIDQAITISGSGTYNKANKQIAGMMRAEEINSNSTFDVTKK